MSGLTCPDGLTPLWPRLAPQALEPSSYSVHLQVIAETPPVTPGAHGRSGLPLPTLPARHSASPLSCCAGDPHLPPARGPSSSWGSGVHGWVLTSCSLTAPLGQCLEPRKCSVDVDPTTVLPLEAGRALPPLQAGSRLSLAPVRQPRASTRRSPWSHVTESDRCLGTHGTLVPGQAKALSGSSVTVLGLGTPHSGTLSTLPWTVSLSGTCPAAQRTSPDSCPCVLPRCTLSVQARLCEATFVHDEDTGWG